MKASTIAINSLRVIETAVLTFALLGILYGFLSIGSGMSPFWLMFTPILLLFVIASELLLLKIE